MYYDILSSRVVVLVIILSDSFVPCFRQGDIRNWFSANQRNSTIPACGYNRTLTAVRWGCQRLYYAATKWKVRIEYFSFLTLSTLAFRSGFFYPWIWTFPLMQIGFQSKTTNWIANKVDPDETARYELSHLDLHYLHRDMFWSVGLKELRGNGTLPGPTSVAQFDAHDWWSGGCTPGRQHSFMEIWSWNIFYCHSLPLADSRRAVVSFWRKNVHNTS